MIKINNIEKTYISKNGIEVKALDGISIDFPDKGLVFIVGKSGSGKSTMLNMLGLLDTFDSGELLIGDKNSADLTPLERDNWRAENIGFIFQEFHIIEKYTIGENISLAMQVANKKVTDSDIAEVLKKVDLIGYEKRKSSDISGGQKQRIAIARALIKNPRIVLADEPTGNLDTANSTAIFNLLKKLSQEQLVIVITHDAESAYKYGDKIIELADGKIIGEHTGEGVREIVKIETEQLDHAAATKINLLLKENKKVVLTSPIEALKIDNDLINNKKPSEIAGQTCSCEAHNNCALCTANCELTSGVHKAKTKLPFKSATRLSLLSMRSNLVRTIFTVLISMFAIAFIGFSDMIAQFSITRLFAVEIRQSTNQFINVGVQEVDDDGIFPTYQFARFDNDIKGKFNELDIEYYNQFSFPAVSKSMRLASYQTLIRGSGNWMQYYSQNIDGMIECDDLSKLGLEVIGREPENNYEVVITNYHLESWKRFGFLGGDAREDHIVGAPVITVNGFEDVEGRYLFSVVPTEIGFNSLYKIVGMVEFDLSDYDEFANMQEPVTPDRNMRQQLQQARMEKNLFLNNIYVKEGFYREWAVKNGRSHINDYTISLFEGEDIYYSRQAHNAIMGSNIVFNIGLHNQGNINPDFTPETSIGATRKVLITSELLKQIVSPDDKASYPDNHAERLIWVSEMIDEYGLYNGNTLSVNARLNSHMVGGDHYNSFDFEIIGVWINDFAMFFPTEDFYEAFYFERSLSLIIPLPDKLAINKALEIFSKGYFFSVNDISYRFAFSTAQSWNIYALDSYFSLFIDIFFVVAIVFGIFSVFLTYNFIRSSIMLRKRDIGILRSLGASRSDVAKIFIIEGGIIAILEIILASITCLLGYVALNNYFENTLGQLAEEYTLTSFSIRQLLIMTALTILSIAASITLPIYKIANKQPVDAIRN